MKIAIFGASGRTGKYLTLMALQQGLTVTALVRHPQDFELSHPQLIVVRGDVLNPADVATVIEGQEAVFSAIGEGIVPESFVRSRGVENIVNAMLVMGVKRGIFIAGTAVLQSENGLIIDAPSFPEMYKPVAEEHRKVWTILQQSGLAWTLFCPPMIPDGVPDGQYEMQENFALPHMAHISTGNLAHAMLQVYLEGAYIQARVSIADKPVS